MVKESARQRNRTLNLEEYRAGCVLLESRPRYLIVELTQGCNLKCPMCRPATITTRTRSMRDALFSRIAAELFETAEMVDLRGWGESLILPDIGERIAEVAGRGAEIRFVTNLSFRRDDVIELLARHGCHVAVSVDTADPHVFPQVRGGGNLRLVTANLDRMIAAYRRHQKDTSLIHFTTTVQRPTVPTLTDLVDFAADRGIREIRLFSVTVPEGSGLELGAAQAEIDDSLKQMEERATLRAVTIYAGTTLGSMPEREPDSAPCLHPWSYAYFSYDGGVGFCDHLIGPEGSDYLLGHLGHSSFEEIWNGEDWQRLRREHLTSRDPGAPCFAECAWCYRHRHVDFEHLFLKEAAKERVPLRRALARG